MSTVIFRYLCSSTSDWPPWTFAVSCWRMFFSLPKDLFSRLEFDLSLSLSLSLYIYIYIYIYIYVYRYNIICSFHKTDRVLTILKQSSKTIVVIFVFFNSCVLENCQSGNWLVGVFTCTCHATGVFGRQCFSTGITERAKDFSVFPFPFFLAMPLLCSCKSSSFAISK